MDGPRKAQLLNLLSDPVIAIDEPGEAALQKYDRALTHSSAGGADNERMEFFGDCVLDFLIGQELYESFDRRLVQLRKRFPLLKDEALLTDMLHEITNDRNLARIVERNPVFDTAIKCGAGQHLTTSIRAGAFEAFIASIYEDRGIEKTREVVHQLFRDTIDYVEPIVSWKNRLQECVQKQIPSANVGEIIQYSTRCVTAPDQDVRHYSEVFVRTSGKDWEPWGTGYGRRGKDAEMDAAKDAYERHFAILQ